VRASIGRRRRSADLDATCRRMAALRFLTATGTGRKGSPLSG